MWIPNAFPPSPFARVISADREGGGGRVLEPVEDGRIASLDENNMSTAEREKPIAYFLRRNKR
jgi:hypothetical protein